MCLNPFASKSVYKTFKKSFIKNAPQNESALRKREGANKSRKLGGEKEKKMNTKNVMLGMAIAAVFLIAAVGSASAANCGAGTAKPVCACGDTVTGDCTFTGNLDCTDSTTWGLKIGASNIVIDGAGYNITGNENAVDCDPATEGTPATHSGIFNNGGWDNVVIKNLEVKNFCTGIALKGSGGNKVTNNTVTKCSVHDNGNSSCPADRNSIHGIHMVTTEHSTICQNEVHSNHGGGSGCSAGGNGIFVYGSGGWYNNITCNYVHNNQRSGIFLKNDGTSGAVTADAIRNNAITSNGKAGIGMHYASIGEISGNTIENNQNPGIGVRDGSVVNLIADNILSGNGVSGTVGFAVREGSIVHIENTTVTHSGKPNLCVLEGSLATIANSTLEYSGQYDGSGPNLRVSGSNVTVTGCFIYESAVPGVVADNSELDFRDNIVARSLHWAMMLTSCSGTLDGNEFYENAYGGGGCLYIRGGGDWDITRNILHHPAWYNNQIYLDATTSSVYSNTICGRADGGGGPWNFGPGDGINVVGGTADIKDNIFYRLPRAITGDGSKTVDYNCYWMMRDSSYNQGDHKVEQDPLFVDPGGYDHTLQSTSPCIDAGIDVGLPYCGSAPDLGAEEYCV